jgi:uncharacterized caspase-like protein
MEFLKRNILLLVSLLVVNVLFGQTSEKPQLHLLSIGPHFTDIHFTAEDATDFVKIFETQNTIYDKGLFQIITDSNATKFNIETALSNINQQHQSGLMKNTDMLILFISSHGFLVDNSTQIHIKGSDFDENDEINTSINFQAFIDSLSTIPCKKIVFIDACFSGLINVDALNMTSTKASDIALATAIQQLMRVQDDWAIFSSSNDEPSWEHSDWQNGAFTEALVEGLYNAQADLNQDFIITINELYSFLSKRVPTLNKEIGFPRQHPQLKNDLGDLPIFAY